ncbi:MAG: M20 family metallopeptidase [Luteolibacter sp.]
MRLLQKLVRIPSVNPEHTPDQPEITGEQKMAEFVADYLAEIGAEVTLEEIQPGRPNAIGRFAPLDGRPRIVLGPHLDTVGVGNMTIEPFSGEIGDGKIWGRGASDTKGSMAAMLEALRENKNILRDLPTAVDFVGFMGEEASQHGSIHFGQHHAQDYRFAIAGEPTSMHIVRTTKGSLWATLSAKGVSAHASQPQLGENAILKLSAALLTLQETISRKLGTFTHPVLGHSTINIGTITGGSAPNIVPNHASAQIDIRQTPSLHQAGGSLKLLRETISELNLPLEISSAHENPPMETDPENPFILQLLATDPRTELTGAPWFSDAAHLAAAGIPSICLGPGSIDQAHTKDEFIEIAALEEGTRYFSKFIRSLAD